LLATHSLSFLRFTLFDPSDHYILSAFLVNRALPSSILVNIYKMKSLFTLAAGIATLSYRVAAHGIVTKITIGTKTYQGYDPNFQYMPTPPAVIGWAAPATQDRGPVPGNALQNPDVICQRGATNAKISAPVAAGDSVSLQWTAWPASHKGPMLDYLADCGADCSTVDKSTLKFFKIDAVGLTSTTGVSPHLP
jgi:lytic cellulose monooxygenase (C1-hydroxylating)